MSKTKKPGTELSVVRKGRKRNVTIFAVCLFIAAIFLSFARHSRHAPHLLKLPSPLTWNRKNKRLTIDENSVEQKGIDTAEYARLTQTEKNRKAGLLIAAGYRTISEARHFDRTVISRYPNGNYVLFHLEYLRSDGSDYYKNETINVDGKTNQEIAGQNRTEITNVQGNWFLSDQVGSEGVAFLLEKSDNNTMANTSNIKADIDRKAMSEGPPTDSDYSILNQTSDQGSVIVVQRGNEGSETQYVLDQKTGALISRYDEFNGTAVTEKYDINVDVPQSEFAISDQVMIMPTANIFSAQAYLMEKAKEP